MADIDGGADTTKPAANGTCQACPVRRPHACLLPRPPATPPAAAACHRFVVALPVFA